MQLETCAITTEGVRVVVPPMPQRVRYTVEQIWGSCVPLPIALTLQQPAPGLQVDGCFLYVCGRLKFSVPCSGAVKLQFLCCHTPIAIREAPPANEPGVYEFLCHVSVFGLPQHARIEVIVEYPEGLLHVATLLLSIAYPPAPELRFTPLLINGLPRSGSTWLMSLLSAHPEVVAAGGYPFEQSHGVYWSLMARVLSQPDMEMHSLRGLQNFTRFVPPSPFNPGAFETACRWFADEYPLQLADSVRGFTDSFYRRETLLQGRADTYVFVEKWPGRLVPHVMRWVFPRVREIFLLRHPRDVILSILRFNARRGFADFGVESYGTGREFIAAVALQLREDLRLFHERTGDGSGVLLDYQRLRRNTEGELAHMLAELDLRHDADAIQAMIETTRQRDMSGHVTSDGSGGQIELSAEQEAWIREEFCDYFEQFPDGR